MANGHCNFPGCSHAVFVKKTPHGPLCNGHYKQYRNGTTLRPLRAYRRDPQAAATTRTKHGTCPYPKCGRRSWHKQGYCQSHSRQQARGEPLRPIRGYLFQTAKTCKYEGCDNAPKSKGWCGTHYRNDWSACCLPDCPRKMHNLKTGFCWKHYGEYRKQVSKGDPDA